MPRRANGGLDARVFFSDQGVSSVASAGRHGNDYVYTAGVRSDRGLRVGVRYRVRDECGAIVIAVGPRGNGAVRAALLGSTSRDVLHFGRYALLATPPAAVDRVLATERTER